MSMKYNNIFLINEIAILKCYVYESDFMFFFKSSRFNLSNTKANASSDWKCYNVLNILQPLVLILIFSKLFACRKSAICWEVLISNLNSNNNIFLTNHNLKLTCSNNKYLFLNFLVSSIWDKSVSRIEILPKPTWLDTLARSRISIRLTELCYSGI